MLELGEISDSVGVWEIKSKSETHEPHAVLKGSRIKRADMDL